MSVQSLDTGELFKKYKESGDIKLRNEIIMRYGGLVKNIAISTRNMYLKYAEVDDIVNEGIIALISAIDGFDIERNVKFETYATIIIRGAIIDFIRKQDFIPRSVRKFSKDLDSAYSHLHNKLNRAPTNSELAEHMDLTEEKLNKMMGDSASAATLSFGELLYENNFEPTDDDRTGEWEAEKGIIKRELYTVLEQAIDSLNDKERSVVSMYYYEKLKFLEIAKIISVSESRVCQIHARAITKLKYEINEYLHK